MAKRANRIITQIEETVSSHCSEVGLAYTPDDLYRLKDEGKKAIMLGIENGYAIGHDIAQIEHFRKRDMAIYSTGKSEPYLSIFSILFCLST